jgi:hypothetical protein
MRLHLDLVRLVAGLGRGDGRGNEDLVEVEMNLDGMVAGDGGPTQE